MDIPTVRFTTTLPEAAYIRDALEMYRKSLAKVTDGESPDERRDRERDWHRVGDMLKDMGNF